MVAEAAGPRRGQDPPRPAAQRVVPVRREGCSGWSELQGLLFGSDDYGVVLALLVDRARRGTRSHADRASDDGPHGPADDRAGARADDAPGDRAVGLLITVRDARRVVLPERFSMLGAVLDDGFALDGSVVVHGWSSCPGFAPVNAARELECAA